MQNLFTRTCALIAVALAASAASAQVMTSAAAFQAAIASDPGQFLNPCSAASGDTFTGGSPAMTYTITGNAGTGAFYHSGAFFGANVPNDNLTITFTSGNVYAVGGEWFFTDSNDVFLPGNTVTLTYSDGTVDTFVPGSMSHFRGYVSASPIAWVRMSAAGSARYSSFDNLVTAAPTPGAAAALTLAGIAALRRRR